MKNLTTVLSLVVLCLLLYSRCRQETVAAEGEYPYLVRKNKIESAYDALRWQMFLWYCRGLPQKIDKGAYNLHKKYFEIDTSCVWVGDISQDTFYFDSSGNRLPALYTVRAVKCCRIFLHLLPLKKRRISCCLICTTR